MRGLKRLMLGIVLLILPARAEEVADVVRIHAEAIGGRERLAALRGLRAEGRVMIGPRELSFTMLAARPNRVRITTRADGRTLEQGLDGVNPPWLYEPLKSLRAVAMEPVEAREFSADAEFDDPLLSPPERGYALDYAGESEWRGRRVLKILVTRAGMPPHEVLLDAETFFIVARVAQEERPLGPAVTVETRYDDFRPVAGVVFPHRIDVYTDGVLTRTTLLSSVIAIPEPPAETFEMPGLR